MFRCYTDVMNRSTEGHETFGPGSPMWAETSKKTQQRIKNGSSAFWCVSAVFPLKSMEPKKQPAAGKKVPDPFQNKAHQLKNTQVWMCPTGSHVKVHSAKQKTHSKTHRVNLALITDASYIKCFCLNVSKCLKPDIITRFFFSHERIPGKVSVELWLPGDIKWHFYTLQYMRPAVQRKAGTHQRVPCSKETVRQ